MIKQSQSLIDFINYLPLHSDLLRQDILTASEKEALMDIWNGNRDGEGNVVLSDSVNHIQVTALTTKGLIENKFATSPKTSYYKTVVITPKGQEVIKNIVLTKEESAFEKSSNSNNIYKTASKKNNVCWRKTWK